MWVQVWTGLNVVIIGCIEVFVQLPEVILRKNSSSFSLDGSIFYWLKTFSVTRQVFFHGEIIYMTHIGSDIIYGAQSSHRNFCQWVSALSSFDERGYSFWFLSIFSTIFSGVKCYWDLGLLAQCSIGYIRRNCNWHRPGQNCHCSKPRPSAFLYFRKARKNPCPVTNDFLAVQSAGLGIFPLTRGPIDLAKPSWCWQCLMLHVSPAFVTVWNVILGLVSQSIWRWQPMVQPVLSFLRSFLNLSSI